MLVDTVDNTLILHYLEYKAVFSLAVKRSPVRFRYSPQKSG